MPEQRWAGTTFGNGWMHRHLILILRYIDVRFFYIIAYVFVVPVTLVLNKSRSTSYKFYHRILAYPTLKSVWFVYRNHCSFAQVVLDRFAMYAGQHFDVRIEGRDDFQTLSHKPEGFLQLSSHIGCYEMAGYSLVSPDKSIFPVVSAKEKQSVMDNRNMMFSSTNVHMIVLKDDMSHLFEIDKALCEGNIVSFPSDRFVEGSRSLVVNFFGQPARFPQGPFSVAAMRGVDALSVNVMKTGSKSYAIFTKSLEYDKTASRGEQLRQLSEAYVAQLEVMLKQYPSQWYNFYDFWSIQ